MSTYFSTRWLKKLRLFTDLQFDFSMISRPDFFKTGFKRAIFHCDANTPSAGDKLTNLVIALIILGNVLLYQMAQKAKIVHRPTV